MKISELTSCSRQISSLDRKSLSRNIFTQPPQRLDAVCSFTSPRSLPIVNRCSSIAALIARPKHANSDREFKNEDLLHAKVEGTREER
jgi:hypothetical protein